MRRREFITLLGGGVTWPLTGSAQSVAKPVIVNFATASFESAAPQEQAFNAGMLELGYQQRRDYELIRKSAEGVVGRLPALAGEVVRLKPNVIFANPTPAVVAVRAHTSTIPIVSFMLADEVRLGLVANSARPGGNVTGLLMRLDGMPGKQIELATEIVPNVRKLGILLNPSSPDTENQRRDSMSAASVRGVIAVYSEVRSPAEIDAAFQGINSEQVQAVVVLFDALFFQERKRIADLAAASRLPVIYAARDHVTSGGLISYGISLRASAHRAASYVDRILKGSKPAELPLEFPTRLELVINLKAAKAIGLDVSPMLLARADEVIE